MRELTDRQKLALDRISNSPAAPSVTVVGWAEGGPVLRTGRGRLVLLKPDGYVREIGKT